MEKGTMGLVATIFHEAVEVNKHWYGGKGIKKIYKNKNKKTDLNFV